MFPLRLGSMLSKSIYPIIIANKDQLNIFFIEKMGFPGCKDTCKVEIIFVFLVKIAEEMLQGHYGQIRFI